MSQAPSFAATHNRGGSNGSYAFSAQRNSFAGPQTSPLRNSAFFASTNSRPSGESMREVANRNSRISFATQPSPTKERPMGHTKTTSLPFPKVGRNGDVLGPLSPEQESPAEFGNGSNGFKTHRAQKSSMNSSLRNEVPLISRLDQDGDCAGALSVIHGDKRLSKLSQMNDGGDEEDQEIVDSSNDLYGKANAGSAHRRTQSEASMKMPRLNRASLSPDQALEVSARPAFISIKLISCW